MTFPRVVLFDFDGTLCNSLETNIATLCASFVFFGLSAPEKPQLLRYFASGHPIDNIIKDLLLSYPDSQVSCDDILRHYRKHYLERALQASVLYPGCIPTLTQLQKHSQLIVVSNHHQNSLQALIEHFHLASFFSAVYGNTPQARLKPDPWFFTNPVTTHCPNLSPHDFLMVGDTTADIGFAKACDLPIAWAQYGYGHIPDPRHADLDYIITSLPNLLDQLAAS